ncbi:MAG: trk/ktr system potassium uptake protein [Thermodesulfobacteriota bacterium]|nr:trk/ktr system potassium uptake protein [Thermodesulfobacteriota bacterium]
MSNRILNRLRRLSPASFLLFSFIAAMLTGAVMLMLPFSTTSGDISFIDALFTSTSAVCVTGLTVLDTGAYFTFFGQIIILILIQLGGLGIMTVSVVLFQFLGKIVSFRQRMAMQETFAHTPRKDIYRLIKSIFIFTFLVEGTGALLLFFHWNREFPAVKALYMAVFHSVSAFCNAGFALFNNNMMNYTGSYLLNFTICGLIVLGGIGFPVVFEIYNLAVKKRGKRVKISVQTKAVLITTVILIVSGTLLFYLMEPDNSLKGLPVTGTILASFFQSITSRTAGFNTVDLSLLSESAASLLVLLMFIGASPGSCGGGIKTTTFFVLFTLVKNRIRGNTSVNVFKKSLGKESVSKSVSIVLLSITFVILVFFLLLMSDHFGHKEIQNADRFISYLFEVVSAFGTVGLSMGATTVINSLGKFLLIITMLIGRVGVLTFSYVITSAEAPMGIEYAEENLMVG